jgi:hypothetical protein
MKTNVLKREYVTQCSWPENRDTIYWQTVQLFVLSNSKTTDWLIEETGYVLESWFRTATEALGFWHNNRLIKVLQKADLQFRSTWLESCIVSEVHSNYALQYHGQSDWIQLMCQKPYGLYLPHSVSETHQNSILRRSIYAPRLISTGVRQQDREDDPLAWVKCQIKIHSPFHTKNTVHWHRGECLYLIH